MMLMLLRGMCNMALLRLFLQGLLLQCLLLQGPSVDQLRAKRTAKSRPTMSSNEAVPSVAPRKQSVANDDRGHSELSQLQRLAGVIVLLSNDSHNAISKASQ
jgi:hypothetical protein